MRRSPAATILAANAELLTRGKLEAIGEYFAPDYVVHFTGRKPSAGHAVIGQIARLYRRAFAELEVEVEILVKTRDRVAWQRTLRGIHRGNFRGFPATGRRVEWRDVVVSRFRRGWIVEDWAISDLAERLLRARKR
jgi:predicted ester cyclase